METYQDRLLEEYAQLEDRTNKLAEFLNSEKAAKVAGTELSYLQAQLPVMRQYLAILSSRVATMPTAKETKAETKKEVPATPTTAVHAPAPPKDDKKK
jgi:uncharacterized protein involved in exopolysaccharide biosynthesis